MKAQKRGIRMKRIGRILLLFLIVIVSLGVTFILTLQAFEYTPADTTALPIDSTEDATFSKVTLDATIRILTFNIGYASLSHTEDFAMDGGKKGRMDSLDLVEANLQGIKNLVLSEAADIYLVQEVDEGSNRSYKTLQYTMFKDAFPQHNAVLGYNFRVIFVPFPLSFSQMMGSVNSGIVSLIKYQVDQADRIQLPGQFDWPLRLANLKRCLVVSRLPIEGSTKLLVVINAHLSAYDNGTMRALETAKLREILEAETAAGNYVVVGGDFNQTFPGAYTTTATSEGPMTDYLYELKNPSLWEAFGLDGTWFTDNGYQFGHHPEFSIPTCRLLHQPYDRIDPTNNQYYYIDGFLVGPGILIERVEVLDMDFEFSDHNPVVMEFRLIP
jgi:endonuclease/exonuclease/phosphatase family metal-dependent hydrolase